MPILHTSGHQATIEFTIVIYICHSHILSRGAAHGFRGHLFTQSVVPVLVGTSDEPQWVVDSTVLVLVDNHTDRHHFVAHTHEKVCEHMISRSSSAPQNSPTEAGRLTARRVIARKEALSPWMGRLSMFERFHASPWADFHEDERSVGDVHELSAILHAGKPNAHFAVPPLITQLDHRREWTI